MSPHSALAKETHQLLEQHVESGLDFAGRERLNDLLRAHEEARETYIAFAKLHGELLWNASEHAEAVADEPSTATTELPRQGMWLAIYDVVSNYAALSMLVSAIFMAIVLLSLGLVMVPELREPASPGGSTPVYVAQVVRTQNAAWSIASDIEAGRVSDLPQGKRLDLQSGLAELRFDDGATVLLEAPAQFTPRGKGRLELHIGRLTARVPQQAIGFTVDTQMASVIDLGTEFGLEVGAGVEDFELAVFDGSVEVKPSGSAGQVVGQGDSVRLKDGRLLASEPPKFVRRFQELPSISVNFCAVEHPLTALRGNGVVRSVPVSCWNNFAVDNSLDSAEMKELIDNRGDTTRCRIAVDSQAGWRVGAGVPTRVREILEDGYWDTGQDDGRIEIEGLPKEFIEDGYRIVVYLHGTDSMGDNTSAEFGARIGGVERWLRWVKNPPDDSFTQASFASEEAAQSGNGDDNMLVFDNAGQSYHQEALTIDVLRDPDAGSASWGRAAVSAIQIIRKVPSAD